MIWPAATMPVPYLVQNAGSPDVTMLQEITAIDAAFATWQAVPCSSLTFTNAGMTDLGVAVDGFNVLQFIESGWIYGAESAAATSLWIVDGQQTADIAFNGQTFTWAIGPPGSGINTNILDLQGVLTHELGHFSGLGHTLRAFDTMYYSWKPWQGQRTISIDDKLGLCSIYPVHGDECPSPACPAEEQCVTHHDGRLCEGSPDPIGAPCNYDRVECDSFCLFTALDLSQGYCSRFCDKNADCPPTHHCDVASAGGMPVKVCFVGAQPPPDAGVGACTTDQQCPTGQHCDVGNGACTFECRAAADCSGGKICDERGFCATGGDGGGCGCRSTGSEPAVFALFGVCLLVLGRRRTTG
jgi:MYXO-CTERM domain-containing protein